MDKEESDMPPSLVNVKASILKASLKPEQTVHGKISTIITDHRNNPTVHDISKQHPPKKLTLGMLK